LKKRISLAAAVLAGGHSRRMGRDKALLKVGDHSLIEELLSGIEEHFEEISIVANDTKRYDGMGFRVLKDIRPDKGPLGGIHTALVNASAPHVFVFSCDMPLVSAPLIKHMSEGVGDADVVVPLFKKTFEPLHAIYSRSCIGPIAGQIDKEDLTVKNLFSRVNTKIIDEETVIRLSPVMPFRNINTREDYNNFLTYRRQVSRE